MGAYPCVYGGIGMYVCTHVTKWCVYVCVHACTYVCPCMHVCVSVDGACVGGCMCWLLIRLGCDAVSQPRLPGLRFLPALALGRSQPPTRALCPNSPGSTCQIPGNELSSWPLCKVLRRGLHTPPRRRAAWRLAPPQATRHAQHAMHRGYTRAPCTPDAPRCPVPGAACSTPAALGLPGPGLRT